MRPPSWGPSCDSEPGGPAGLPSRDGHPPGMVHGALGGDSQHRPSLGAWVPPAGLGWGRRLGCGCRGRVATGFCGASQKWEGQQGGARAQVPTGSPCPRGPGLRATSLGSVCGSSAYGRMPGGLVPMGCLAESVGPGKQRRKTGTCSSHPCSHPSGRDQGAECGQGQLAEGVPPSGEAFMRRREGV